MTYRTLLMCLLDLMDTDLDTTVTIVDAKTKEVFGVTDLFFVSSLPDGIRMDVEDTLEQDQPLMIFNYEEED